MEFIHISPWVNCVRQFAYLNDQGGTTASIYDTKVDINYPISFKSKVLWGGVTIDHSGISSGGLAAYFQSADLKRGKVTSDAISDAFTADIKYIVIGY